MSAPVLEVNGLRTEFPTEDGVIVPVNDVSFTLHEGETIGLVGESGAGKSMTAKSILQLVESPGSIVDGEVLLNGDDLLEYSNERMQSIRGNRIALIPQDPMTSLNPVLTVGEQIIETIVHHQDVTKKEAREIAIGTMEDVEIPDAEHRIDDYPHEFSGGMRQRVLISIALSCDPDVLIADEPTTAIDVTTQAKILDLIEELQEEHDLSILIITHNLGVIAQMCNRLNVMYAGHIVEQGEIEEVFARPQHPYTRALIDAIPTVDGRDDRLYALSGSMPTLVNLPEGCNFADRCEHAVASCREGSDPPLRSTRAGTGQAACLRQDELDLSESNISDQVERTKVTVREANEEPLLDIRNLKKYFPAGEGFFGNLSFDRSTGVLPKPQRRHVKAVDGVSFSSHLGETVGLVGESGCGKSTVAETILGLLEPTDGEIYFDGRPLHELDKQEFRELRQDIQIIFQDPQSSLNPRKTVGQIIGRPMEKHGIATGGEKRERVKELLERVGLSGDDIDKYPHEFSGGQQQRIAIAHALAPQPKLIVCDEPVSALDVTVQAQILNLLDDLQDEFDLSYLFISHNIGVIRHICDRVAVMYLGTIAEYGPADRVFTAPFHPYTESLLSAVPHADPERKTDPILLEGTVPSPANPPSGCRFRTRCPKVIPPDRLKLSQQAFREIMDFRAAVESRAFNLDRLRKTARPDSETREPGVGDSTALAKTLVWEESFEESLPEEAREIVDQSIEELVDGNWADAENVLRANFGSVCERSVPELTLDGDEESVMACHLQTEWDRGGARSTELESD